MKKALLFTVLTFCSLISFSQWNNQDEMTIGELYNFDVGDILEFTRHDYIVPNHKTDYIRRTYYDKEVYTDSIVYHVENQFLKSIIKYNDLGHRYYEYTLTVDSITNTYTQLNSMIDVGEGYYSLNIDTLIRYRFGNDTALALQQIDTSYNYVDERFPNLPDSLKVFGLSMNEFESSTNEFSVEGLGWIKTGYGSIDYVNSTTLIYYKKSYGSEGTPHLFPTGIDDPNRNPANLLVYPNPATEFINIRDVSFQKAYAYQIFNLSGQLVQQGMLQSGEERINIQSLNSGMYLLHTENRDQPVKIFVQ